MAPGKGGPFDEVEHENGVIAAASFAEQSDDAGPVEQPESVDLPQGARVAGPPHGDELERDGNAAPRVAGAEDRGMSSLAEARSDGVTARKDLSHQRLAGGPTRSDLHCLCGLADHRETTTDAVAAETSPDVRRHDGPVRCVAAVLLAGCLSVEVGPDGPSPRPVPDPGSGCAAVALTTADDVRIEADRCPANPGAPLAVLVHGIGPHNDRTRWPHTLRTALVERGFEVWVVDLRGSGESQGVARDAWAGDAGGLDVDAVIRAAEASRPAGGSTAWVGLASGHGARAIVAASSSPNVMVVLSPGPWLPATEVPTVRICGAQEAESCEPRRDALAATDVPVLAASGHGTNLLDAAGGLSSTALAVLVADVFRGTAVADIDGPRGPVSAPQDSALPGTAPQGPAARREDARPSDPMAAPEAPR